MGFLSGTSPYLGLIKFNVNSIATGKSMDLILTGKGTEHGSTGREQTKAVVGNR